jgi:hypothetical protein
MRTTTLALSLCVALPLFEGCGGDDSAGTDTTTPDAGADASQGGAGGSAGIAGQGGAGHAGQAGASGTGGSAGSAGSGGVAGAAGTAGDAGAAGTAGASGSGGSSTGGAGGQAGSAGAAGTAGGGAAGSAGSAGAGGSAGSCAVGVLPSRTQFTSDLAGAACKQQCPTTTDLTSCKTVYSEEYAMLFGDYTFDPAQAALCEGLLGGQTGCPSESCSQAFVSPGTAALGAPCSHASDCASIAGSKVACNDYQQTSSGGKYYVKICQQVLDGTVGGPCEEEGTPPPHVIHACVDGQATCSFNNVCEADTKIGDACTTSCGSQLACKSGHCAAYAVGDACTSGCGGTMFCNAAHQCEQFHAQGGVCAADNQCDSKICDGLALKCEDKLLCTLPASSAETQFRDQEVDAYCTNAVAPTCAMYGLGHNQAWCKEVWLKNVFGRTDMSYTAIPDGAVLNASAAAACLTALQANTNTIACDQALPSALQHAPGGTCLHKSDCQVPGNNHVSCEKGICIERVIVAAGAACDTDAASATPPTAHLCDTNSYCDTSTKVCIAKKAAGVACTQSAACQSGLDCVTGTCTALAPLGANCTYDAECAAQASCLNGKCHNRLMEFFGILLGCEFAL